MHWFRLVLPLLMGIPAFAQHPFTLHCLVREADRQILQHTGYTRQHADSAAAFRELTRLIETLRQRSYVTASADRIESRQDSLLVWLQVGQPFQLALEAGNVPEELLREAGYRNNRIRPLSYQAWTNLSERILVSADNRGYPFASVRLDSIREENGRMRAAIRYQSGPVIIFDTLEVRGNAKLKQRFLSAYVNILPGQLFSQQKLTQANRLLVQLPYLQQTSPPSVRFRDDRAYVQVSANHRKTNQFDGIIGFLPNQQAPGKLLVTGDVSLRLNNLFGQGKSLRFQWQQIQRASPLLHLEYGHPTLIGTRLELKANLDLLKQDSTFLNVNRRITLAYPLGNAGKLHGFTGLRTSRLSNSNQYLHANALPDASDVHYLSYGVGYEWNTLNDYYYPKRGLRLFFQGEAGNKRVIKNPFLDQKLYEGLALNALQVTARVAAQQYVPLSARSVLLAGMQAATIRSKNLFVNDLFRLGGLNSLRGFNENFFYTSDYALGTLEYRFFTDSTSYLLLFYDQAWLALRTLQGNAEDTPLGLGTGISFTTKAGNFSLLYSVGKSASQPLRLNYSKIHFGFVSIF